MMLNFPYGVIRQIIVSAGRENRINMIFVKSLILVINWLPHRRSRPVGSDIP